MQYSQRGLTLLEVLIALVVIAIALTAIIKVTTENIRATAYLQEKTTATWVGLHILNEARLELIQLPPFPEHRDAQLLALNHRWEWQGCSVKTPNPRIQELHIKVFHQPEHQLMTELTSYLYAA